MNRKLWDLSELQAWKITLAHARPAVRDKVTRDVLIEVWNQVSAQVRDQVIDQKQLARFRGA